MANRGDAYGDGKDCDASVHPGPWERDRGALPFSWQQNRLSGDDYEADPQFAALVWIAALLAGATFWVAVFRFIF